MTGPISMCMPRCNHHNFHVQGQTHTFFRLHHAAVTPVRVDPAVHLAMRAAAALEARKERRVVSLTGIYYPNGQTFLQWSTPGPDGVWQTYEAWTLTDFRSAWLVQEFEVRNTIYYIFPTVLPATKWDQRRAFPGPLYFPEGSLGFRLIKGNPNHAKSIEPIAALHEIYRNEGVKLTEQWLSAKAAEAAAAEWLRANPPPAKDITVRYWPGQNVELLPIHQPKTAYRRRQ
jgi:hypothetical protein